MRIANVYRPGLLTCDENESIAAVAKKMLEKQVGALAVRPNLSAPWWRIGVAYAVLLLFLGRPLWEGTPPAVVRIELPLLAAFNISLLGVKEARWFWTLLVCGNLAALMGPVVGMP